MIQHKLAYAPLQLLSALVPTVQIGSWIGPIIFIVGFLMAGALGATLAWVGVGLFASVALLALVTLPVEFDASRRAKQQLVASGIVIGNELRGVNAVLEAAAMTYVAGAVQALSTLLYKELPFLLVTGPHAVRHHRPIGGRGHHLAVEPCHPASSALQQTVLSFAR